MLLHKKGHHTWHNLCKLPSHLSCGHLFEHPSLPNIIWGEQKGGMRNAYVPLKGNSPSDSWEFQSYSNPSAPTAETQPCPLKPVQVQRCWTRRSGSAVTVTSCCKHVQELPIHSLHPLPHTAHQEQRQVRRWISFPKFIQYIAENETHPFILSTTAF